MNNQKTCATCGNLFTPQHWKERYCKNPCRNLKQRHYHWRECLKCGVRFESTSVYHKWCSWECKKAYPKPKVETVDVRSFCFYCGVPLNPKNTHVDHAIPKTRGGHDEDFNKIRACGDCNMTKNKMMPWEYIKWLQMKAYKLGYKSALSELTGQDVKVSDVLVRE
jgi:5-methylcytosine-specific restriction endonuclease McrA